MKGSMDQRAPAHSNPELPTTLADYADRVLLGTGLEAGDAVLIANGQLDPPAELSRLATALRAGWMAEEEPA
jgi:hypothetical protein